MEIGQAINRFTLIFKDSVQEENYQNRDRQIITVVARITIYIIYVANSIIDALSYFVKPTLDVDLSSTLPSLNSTNSSTGNSSTSISSSSCISGITINKTYETYAYYTIVVGIPAVVSLELLTVLVPKLRYARGTFFIISIYLGVLSTILRGIKDEIVGLFVCLYR